MKIILFSKTQNYNLIKKAFQEGIIASEDAMYDHNAVRTNPRLISLIEEMKADEYSIVEVPENSTYKVTTNPWLLEEVEFEYDHLYLLEGVGLFKSEKQVLDKASELGIESPIIIKIKLSYINPLIQSNFK